MKKKLCALLLLGLCLISISACGNKLASENTNNALNSSQTEEASENRDTEEIKENTGDKVEKQDNDIQGDAQTLNEEKSNDDTTSEDAENREVNRNEELVDGMRPEFKEAMDSYEAFYDEYFDIMKKYAENPSDMKLLVDYTDMLTKAAEMTEKFDAWEDSDMNNTELKYYLDVNNRITKKLLDVAE